MAERLWARYARTTDVEKMQEGYGPCLSCKRETIICPTTQKENGLICVDCLLKDLPCHYQMLVFGPHLVHNHACPEHTAFDRRKTRTNWSRCALNDPGAPFAKKADRKVP